MVRIEDKRGRAMGRKRHTPEQIIRKLREAEGRAGEHHSGTGKHPSAITGAECTAELDMMVSVDADLPTLEAHEIADEIERRIRAALPVEDVSIHVEPER
jgi:divalent metal cation (Fe/Co/Zn/Cd) transporter